MENKTESGVNCPHCNKPVSGKTAYYCPDCFHAVCPDCAKKSDGVCRRCFFYFGQLRILRCALCKNIEYSKVLSFIAEKM